MSLLPLQLQMVRADIRMVQLKDMLHKSKLKPMTLRDNQEGEGVLRKRTLPQMPRLVGAKDAFNPNGSDQQLPRWMAQSSTLMLKIKRINTEWMGGQWQLPLTIGQQLSTTLINRSVMPTNKQRLVRVTLRALPEKYGKPRFDNIKVGIVNDAGDTRMYYARCAVYCFLNAMSRITYKQYFNCFFE